MGSKSGPVEALVEVLTPRELEILAHLAKNQSNSEIAQLENLALSSVKWYVNQILSKLAVKSRVEAVTRAVELGLIHPEEQAAKPKAQPLSNLPRQLSSFIGREREIDHLAGLVCANPLVTVTGAGGVGKTRLAIEAASRLITRFPNGVWFIELAPLSNPDQVVQTLVSIMGVAGKQGLAPIEQLCEFLRVRQFLLVVDNCEHVLGAVAALTHTLLHNCPRLSILATSREFLGVEGEVVYRCPSLSLPDEARMQAHEESEAEQLFARRAWGNSSAHTPIEEESAAIRRICRRLDGIPLAIELAAARTRLLSVEQIAARLDNVFGLLTGGARTDLPRHQTLQALIEWSFELLSEEESILLERLSVFAGSWGMETTEAVCTDLDGLLVKGNILTLLGKLVDKSLVETFPGLFGMRYRMLETIRQYAKMRLVQQGQEATLRERHLDAYLAFCLEAEPYLIGPRLREWRERVDAELDNVRSAMEYSLAGSVEKGLRIAAALQWYWHARMNLLVESISWFERLLAAEAAGPDDLRLAPARRIARGKTINVVAHRGIDHGHKLAREAVEIFSQMGDDYRLDHAIALLWSGEKDLQEILSLFRAIGDRFWITNSLWELTESFIFEGNYPQAKQCLEESLALLREIGYHEGEGSVLLYLGRIEFWLGFSARGIELTQAAAECFHAAGSIGKSHYPVFSMARFSLAQGDYHQAEEHLMFCVTNNQVYDLRYDVYSGFLLWTAFASGDLLLTKQRLEELSRQSEGLADDEFSREAYYVMARKAILEGDYPQAYSNLTKIDRYFAAPVLAHAYAILAASQGNLSRAAVLMGSLEAYPWWTHMVPPPEREAYQKALETVRAGLSAEKLDVAWTQGKALTARQAIDGARTNMSSALAD